MSGCNVGQVFVCTTDAQCTNGGIGGRCQQSGYCSFGDSGCSSGQRYGSLAGEELAGTCVDAETGTSTETSAGSGDIEGSSPTLTLTTDATMASTGDSTIGVTTQQMTAESTAGTSSASSSGGAESSGSTSTGVTLDPDLLAWYRFDGPIRGAVPDSSGNGHTGTCSQCPEVIPGVYDGAIGLDGVDQYIVVPDVPEFATQTWTLSAWVWSPAPPLEYLTVVGKPLGTGTDNSFELGLADFGEVVLVAAWHDGVTAQVLTGPLPAHQEWVHVASSVSSDTATLYINGDVVDEAPVMVVSAYDNSSFYVGADVDLEVVDNFFVGSIDDVRLYGRALGADEVATVMAGENL